MPPNAMESSPLVALIQCQRTELELRQLVASTTDRVSSGFVKGVQNKIISRFPRCIERLDNWRSLTIKSLLCNALNFGRSALYDHIGEVDASK